MDIKVISSEIDGARLRKEKAFNKYYSVCDGSKDNDEINEALAHKGGMYKISPSDWERIFGGNR